VRGRKECLTSPSLEKKGGKKEEGTSILAAKNKHLFRKRRGGDRLPISYIEEKKEKGYWLRASTSRRFLLHIEGEEGKGEVREIRLLPYLHGLKGGGGGGGKGGAAPNFYYLSFSADEEEK